MKQFTLLAAIVASLTFSTVASATSSKDLEILGRALGFVEGGLPSSLNIAVVHDAGNADSKGHADELMGLMGGGLNVGKITFTSSLVDAGSPGDFGGAQVAFVTKGLSGQESGIFSSASGRGMVVVGELSCVEAGNCVINVTSTPSVKIYVSKAAAAAASVSFADAFRMMITEK